MGDNFKVKMVIRIWKVIVIKMEFFGNRSYSIFLWLL